MAVGAARPAWTQQPNRPRVPVRHAGTQCSTGRIAGHADAATGAENDQQHGQEVGEGGRPVAVPRAAADALGDCSRGPQR